MTGRGLFDCLGEAIPGSARVGPERAIGLDGSMNLFEGFIFLLFEDDKPDPSYCVKLSDSPGLTPVLRTEHVNLERLKKVLPAGLRERVPAPLWQGETGGFYVTIRTMLDGETLKNIRPSKTFSRRRVLATLSAVSEWLLGLYRAVTLPRPNDPELSPWHGQRTEALYLDYFICTENERAVVRRAWARVRDGIGRGMPMVPIHGDLCAANVILSERKAGIIDWEMPLEPHLPLFDLFTFCASTRSTGRLLSSTDSHFASFKRAFFGKSYLARAVATVIGEHAERLGVEADLVPHLFVAAQTELAVLKYRTAVASHLMDLAALSGGEADDEARARRWSRIPLAFMDLPMVCIRGGRCLNVRYTADRFDRFVPGSGDKGA